MTSHESNGIQAFSRVQIRPYRSEDAAATLRVFVEAVTVTAAADYGPEQTAAWAGTGGGGRDLAEWDQSMLGRNSFVAIVDEQIAGFSDVSDDGYIDMLFVSPSAARRGVGRSLLEQAESRARKRGATRLEANVSITAKPLFEVAGFSVDAEQRPVVDGVAMTNYRMRKTLSAQG